ncbi:NOTC3-like protein, partial [Mya arenaria]
IDECAVVGNYFCRINWNQTRWCTNTAGSYYCGCNRGWTGKHCENDVNECDGGNLCGQNADCTNTFGSYNCNCRPGYPQGNPFYGCYTLNYPPLYEAFGAENSTQWAKYVENHVVIAPLWTNLDSRNITGAGVWVHVFSNNSGNRSDILQIQKLVRKYSDNSEFNASVAFAVTWKHNLSMQVIAVTDGLYTYLLFNYDQEEFSIQPNSYTPVAAGYTFPGNFTGKILANSHNFTNLKTDSNVNQGP